MGVAVENPTKWQFLEKNNWHPIRKYSWKNAWKIFARICERNTGRNLGRRLPQVLKGNLGETSRRPREIIPRQTPAAVPGETPWEIPGDPPEVNPYRLPEGLWVEPNKEFLEQLVETDFEQLIFDVTPTKIPGQVLSKIQAESLWETSENSLEKVPEKSLDKFLEEFQKTSNEQLPKASKNADEQNFGKTFLKGILEKSWQESLRNFGESCEAREPIQGEEFQTQFLTKFLEKALEEINSIINKSETSDESFIMKPFSSLADCDGGSSSYRVPHVLRFVSRCSWVQLKLRH